MANNMKLKPEYLTKVYYTENFENYRSQYDIPYNLLNVVQRLEIDMENTGTVSDITDDYNLLYKKIPVSYETGIYFFN